MQERRRELVKVTNAAALFPQLTKIRCESHKINV